MTKNKRFVAQVLLVLTATGFAATGCGGEADLCPSGQVDCDGVCINEIAATLESVHSEVFLNTCAVSSSCHLGQARSAEGLGLDTVSIARAQLVGMPSAQDPGRNRVVPGDPDNSYLMNKLDGVNLANASNGMPSQRMPLLAEMCDARIEAVRAWIAAGAP